MKMIKWEEWGDKAFARARETGRAVFLWITYRGCRACARMEEESFADPEITEKIHTQFVPVHVDRDEHPDVDRHFQRVFHAMLGKEEGWPLTLFLAPDYTPLHMAAYVPPEARDGMMGMETLLDLVAKQYAADPEALSQKGKNALSQLLPKQSIEATQIDPEALATVLRRQMHDAYDPKHGGYGETPKYPHIGLLMAGLQLHAYDGGVEPFHSLRYTLDRILEAPIWDTKNGGMFCCTLDEAWQVPQHRKHLAENAMMVRVLLRADAMADDSDKRYSEAAYALCDWGLKSMRDSISGLCIHGEIDGAKDTRIFTAPNALMATALLIAAQSEERFRPDALELLHRLMEMMLSGFELHHQLGTSDTTTYLVDYAALGLALLAAYDLTQNEHFLATAGEIAGAAIRRFYDRGFWAVGDGEWRDPTVFVDTTLPSPAATITHVLHRLSRELDGDYAPFVQQTLAVSSYQLMRRPIAKAGMAEVALQVYGEGSK